MILDRATILAVSAIISFVLGAVLLSASARGRLGSWALCWGGGTLALGLAGADQAVKGLLPDAWLISTGNLLAISGTALVVQGARLFAGRKTRWPLFAATLFLILLPLVLSHDPNGKAARVAYNNAILIICDLWVAVEAIRLLRHERLGTAWLMLALFTIPVPFSILRFFVAVTTIFADGSLDQARVNTWLAALLAALWSLRGALPALLIAERSSQALERIAHHDSLTGALNRAGFERMKGALRGLVSIAVMDLDHFKEINDRHGHARGDLVLRTLAEVVGDQPAGALVRLGGDEFLLVLPDVSAMEGAKIVEAIRGRFANAMRALFPYGSVPTISAGIATGNLGSTDLDQLTMEADKALYRSKASGRDRVAIAQIAA